ncbi:hypothetical protein DPMN_123713 [Dreissena polymorpha]|uniref:C-type lectin domain-containing protein n=1 Tax=Dreissena polymorpha TaxID=45954 RepID=A0A9D4JRJ4_DREPO|nr:hypothetical protein DPMN_123713 [Dreissena polymorpha]
MTQMTKEESGLWVEGRPNGGNIPHCLRLSVNAGYLLDDIDCDNRYLTICEQD